MTDSRSFQHSRRHFLTGASALGAMSLLGYPRVAAAEPPPETTTIRLTFDPQVPVLCFAPQYVAEQYLNMEGFNDVRHVPFTQNGGQIQTLIANQADVATAAVADWLGHFDRGDPVVVFSGLHQGCFELIADPKFRSIGDLKGRRVAAFSERSGEKLLIASIVAYIGMNPDRDIKWVYANPNDWSRMLAGAQVDAIGAFPPMSYDLHAKRIGRVILSTSTDKPWQNYLCCMVGARREFTQDHPVAAKRALRAILKANQLCSLEPQRTARWLVERGFASNYDYALQTLTDIPYAALRTHNPEDTLRFYGLRLHEVGMIKHHPSELIAQGTDWRFLNELKKEMKT